jgi:hypothetical protein
MSEADDESVAGRGAFVIFMLGELCALVFYLVVSRPMWFFQDEWDFLANRTAFNLHDLFQPHNEHWVTLPTLGFRALWWIFGLRTYRPYQVVIVLLHLGAALLIRMVMRRAGVRPWTATIAALVLVFFGSGYQNIILPIQMTLVGSLVFGVVHLLLADHEGAVDRRDYLGLLAGLAALLCSGVGVAMVIAVGAAVLIRRGWRAALLHTVPLSLVYVVWFASIGHEGYTGKHGSLVDVARFVRMMVATTFGAIGHYRGLGLVLGGILVVGLVLAWRPLPASELRSRAAAPVGLLIGAFSLLCITGYGRAGLVVLDEKSRYLHLVAAMLLPALAVAADAIMRRWRVVAPVVAVVLVIGIPSNIDVVVNYMHRPFVKSQLEYRRMMLSLPRVPAAKEAPRHLVPEQELAHFVTIGWLLDGVRSGRIPKPSHISDADAAMDEIRLSLEQFRARGIPLGYECIGSKTPLEFHLQTGDMIVVSAPKGIVEITPPEAVRGEAFPFRVITVQGPILRAVRPIAFRTGAVAIKSGQVCARPKILRAAQQAALD